MAKGLGAAADRASQAREVFAERGKARLEVEPSLGFTDLYSKCHYGYHWVNFRKTIIFSLSEFRIEEHEASIFCAR